MLEILSVLFFTIGILFISLTIFVENFAESVTNCRKRILEVKNECKKRVEVAREEAIATKRELDDKNDRLEELSAKLEALETSNKELKIALNEVPRKEKSIILAPQYIDEYKDLCEKEKQAFEFVLNEYNSFFSNTTRKLLEGIEIGRLHNYFDNANDYYFTDFSEIVHNKQPKKNDTSPYKTTLTSCGCYDFRKRGVPACKHMLFLAYSLGILQIYREKHQAYFDNLIIDAKKSKSEGENNSKDKKSPQKRKTNRKATSPSLSDKSKNTSSRLRGSEEDM